MLEHNNTLGNFSIKDNNKDIILNDVKPIFDFDKYKLEAKFLLFVVFLSI